MDRRLSEKQRESHSEKDCIVAVRLILLTLLVSCGSDLGDFNIVPHQEEKDPRTITSINPEFAPYYKEFQDVCNIVPTTPIDFKEIESPSVGLCRMWTGQKVYTQIEIDPSYWEKASEPHRRWLVFHELGHCLLGLEHDETMEDGVPASIMHPYIAHKAEELLEQGYLERLCKGS